MYYVPAIYTRQMFWHRFSAAVAHSQQAVHSTANWWFERLWNIWTANVLTDLLEWGHEWM